jgi:photosystem II stability/assembly factor-like uncharacterized protein
MFKAVIATLAMLTAAIAQQEPAAPQPTLITQNSGTKKGLIAVSAANARVVWACGSKGTFTVTTDGGNTWKAGVVPGAETLQFRDVQAVSDKVAYLLSVGSKPEDFRIYKTTDAGASWTLQFQNQNAKAFYDCFAFWTPARGIAVSDSVEGRFPDLRTGDGKRWQDIGAKLPTAQAGEGSFASSGTCVATQGKSNAWIATGNGKSARILATSDGGTTWTAYDTPLPSAQGAGAFTVAFRDAQHGILGGGNLDAKQRDQAATAISSDGGKTWKLTSKPPVSGAIYGLSYVGGPGELARAVVITANEGGAAWTPDEGITWHKLPDVSGYWGVTFASPEAGWLVGTEGRILKVRF